MAEPAMTFMIEDARIIYRNFEGRESQFNQKGQRSFAVILDEDTAQRMLDDGWNVKYTKVRDEGDEPEPFIPVAVRYDIRPPRVYLLTSTTRTQLNESQIEVLDWADIRTADLIARGNDWNVNGKSGIKAYLQSLFVTIEEDALEKKYEIYDNPPDNFNE